MLTLRALDAENAYSYYYEKAYPYDTDEPFRAASLDDINLATISKALTLTGEPLASTGTSASGPASPSVVAISNLPGTQRVTVQQDYGNASMLPVAVTTADQIALLRPATRRVFLQFQNRDDSLGNVFVAFGTTASSANGVKILPGGSYTLDQFVPQDDVHVIGDNTATLIIVYCNKDEKE